MKIREPEKSVKARPDPIGFSDLTTGVGKALWAEVNNRLQTNPPLLNAELAGEAGPQYGSPSIVLPSLGQGSFRILVTDAYDRRCAVTQERTLPALEASHIKPFSESGPHKVSNGILLRSDVHRLTGYVTITPEYRFEVSRKIRDEFENGRDYYAMNGRVVRLPTRQEFRPGKEFITWHNENVFRG
jgi:putative restriction endonuclease